MLHSSRSFSPNLVPNRSFHSDPHRAPGACWVGVGSARDGRGMEEDGGGGEQGGVLGVRRPESAFVFLVFVVFYGQQ